MKLCKLYSNKPDKFHQIEFVEGLNIILAEKKLENDNSKDVHNVGKSTIGLLLDFCLLSDKDNDFFLFKHYDLFKEFIFFLEIEIENDIFLTIRRSVAEATKICFIKAQSKYNDFSNLEFDKWDQVNIPIKRAKNLLDSYLNWSIDKPWSYRNCLGYQLRKQEDYIDVFQLNKFKGPHEFWKPFLGYMMGFDANSILEYYQIENEIDESERRKDIIEKDLSGPVTELNKVQGILLLKQEEINLQQKRLDEFNFYIEEKKINKKIVTDIDEQIATLNAKRYSLSVDEKKILSLLKEKQLLFNIDEATKLYNEIGILFDGQIKKDFQQLIEFNNAISNERYIYLKQDLSDIQEGIKEINSDLQKLGAQRKKLLMVLNNADTFDKYKHLSNEMAIIKADMINLKRQRDILQQIQNLRFEINQLQHKRNILKEKIENNVDEQNENVSSLFSNLRKYFSYILDYVINRKALLDVKVNKTGHLDFSADILDKSGNSTSADLGHTYKKLLCIAFDLSLIYSHQNENFPRFVYHDGVFESLDDRKKIQLLDVFRNYSSLGFQPIITLIDSDIPAATNNPDIFFLPDEIILRLHDKDESGRLFMMESW